MLLIVEMEGQRVGKVKNTSFITNSLLWDNLGLTCFTDSIPFGG
jgi:hypothetical protein